MSKHFFETLIFFLERFDYDGLKELMIDTLCSGVKIKCVLAGNKEMSDALIYELDSNNSYLITDCAEGVGFALNNTIGYSLLENDCQGINAPGAECIILGFDEVKCDFVHKLFQRHFKLPWDILETERLRIREITVDDVASLYEVYKDKSVTKYMEDLFEDPLEERIYTQDYIKNVYEICGFGLWLVIDKINGEIIGRVGLDLREGYEEAELAYMIAADKQRRGYAYEACSAVVDYARNTLGMKALNCFINSENKASICLCEKLGFKCFSEVCLNGISMLRYYLVVQ